MANMKKLFIATMAIGLTLTAITAFAQTAKEAIFGLKKLQARCQIGISYKDYSSAVADAKFPVNLFIESADAEKFPDLKAAINKAMEHYETANLFWNRRMNVRQGEVMLESGLIWTKSPMGQYISNNYPEAVAIEPTTGVNWLLGNPKYYPLDSVLPIMWNKASKELENATAIYSTIEGETSNDIDKIKQENEKLKTENENLKKQLELIKSKNKK
ncbi:MAG TPA: hypothetical protein P5347_01135 [Smithellaceae bacterium]|nr:hypothetical protein [Smithellaceae bacterium]